MHDDVSAIARELSEYIAGALRRDLPADVAGKTKLHVLDALAAMLAAALDDLGSRAAVAAERAFLAAVEAGCTAPVGALADVAEDELYLRGVIASLDGEEVFRQSMTGAVTDPGEVGRRLAREMFELGAADVLASPPTGGSPMSTGEQPQ